MVSSPIWPANEEFFSFRILEPAPGEDAAGDIKIGVAKPELKRWEFTYGQYSFIQVQNGSEYATLRSQPTEPAPLTSVRKIIPVGLGRFEQADIVRRIEDKNIEGQAARCISFDTLKGDHQQPGRVCVDVREGWLLELTQGDETLRQSKFYRFNNAFLPGHIERWVANRKLIEIDENIVIREQYPPDYFDYPTGSSLRNTCTAFQRAFVDNTPQPAQKMSSNDFTDVRLHGFIGKDGKPYGLKVLDTFRSDLAKEAVRVVSNWTYHPAMCLYEPANMETDFVVHFKGW